MPEIKISIPEDLHREVEAHPEIDWAEVARRSFQQTVDRIHVHDRLLEDSRLTEEDAVELAREIRQAASERRRR